MVDVRTESTTIPARESISASAALWMSSSAVGHRYKQVGRVVVTSQTVGDQHPPASRKSRTPRSGNVHDLAGQRDWAPDSGGVKLTIG